MIRDFIKGGLCNDIEKVYMVNFQKMMLSVEICCLLLPSIILFNLGAGQEVKNVDKSVLPDCKAIVVGIMKQHLKAYTICLKEMKNDFPDNAELSERLNCAIKCVLEKTGLLNDEKKVTKQTVQDYMDKNIPNFYHDIGHEVSGHCYDEFGPQMDHDDEYCHAYGKFVECMQHVVANVAEIC